MEEIKFKIATTEQDYEGILALQNQNLLTTISPNLQNQVGFVFAKHTIPLLKQMADKLPQIIAVVNEEVIGYNLAMNNTMKNYLPSILPMFNEFDKCSYKQKALNDYNYVVGGQVCVSAKFRGIGLIKSLYQHTQKLVQKEYDLCVTEIATRNITSLNAHKKMGFEVIGSYNDKIEDWNIVLLDFQKHPLLRE